MNHSYSSPDDPDFAFEQQVRDEELGRIVAEVNGELRTVGGRIEELSWLVHVAFVIALAAIVLSAIAFGRVSAVTGGFIW